MVATFGTDDHVCMRQYTISAPKGAVFFVKGGDTVAKRLVLGAQRFNFEADGRRIAGATMHILEPRPTDPDGNRIGFQTLSVPASLDVFLELSRQDLPAIFDCDEGLKPNAKGRAEMFVRAVSYVQAVDMALGVGL